MTKYYVKILNRLNHFLISTYVTYHPKKKKISYNMYLDIDLDWDNLESNTINSLRYACQQLRLYTKGNLKKDYIFALRAFHLKHPEITSRSKATHNDAFITSPIRDASNESQQYQNEFNQNQVQSHPKSTKYQKVHSRRNENIVSEQHSPKSQKNPRSTNRYKNYSNDKSANSDYSSYSPSYQSDKNYSESERMSPLLPEKSSKRKSSKRNVNKASTQKKVFSTIISVILVILIILVALLLL